MSEEKKNFERSSESLVNHCIRALLKKFLLLSLTKFNCVIKGEVRKVKY